MKPCQGAKKLERMGISRISDLTSSNVDEIELTCTYMYFTKRSQDLNLKQLTKTKKHDLKIRVLQESIYKMKPLQERRHALRGLNSLVRPRSAPLQALPRCCSQALLLFHSKSWCRIYRPYRHFLELHKDLWIFMAWTHHK